MTEEREIKYSQMGLMFTAVYAVSVCCLIAAYLLMYLIYEELLFWGFWIIVALNTAGYAWIVTSKKWKVTIDREGIYLWGNSMKILFSEMTFASYAERSFASLVKYFIKPKTLPGTLTLHSGGDRVHTILIDKKRLEKVKKWFHVEIQPL